MSKQSPIKGKSLFLKIVQQLRETIVAEKLQPGDKLPSEARLSETYGVSRTVVREAIAALRADGLVEPRRGAGVFVTQEVQPEAQPFQNIDHARISSVIELIELRIALESEAAALAAMRRSPAQEEAILNQHHKIQACISAGNSMAADDFALHRAISVASNNPRFVEFMDLIGVNAIPRANLQVTTEPDYLSQIHQEHGRIVMAISDGDSEQARQAMRDHLGGSQRRYRALLRRD